MPLIAFFEVFHGLLMTGEHHLIITAAPEIRTAISMHILCFTVQICMYCTVIGVHLTFAGDEGVLWIGPTLQFFGEFFISEKKTALCDVRLHISKHSPERIWLDVILPSAPYCPSTRRRYSTARLHTYLGPGSQLRWYCTGST